MEDSKFHRFWERNLNPITMKKNDTELHPLNLSKEDVIQKQLRRENTRLINVIRNTK